MSTFIAQDKKRYESDTWYPLPFVIGRKSMLPLDFENPAFGCLRVLRGGKTEIWGPFHMSKTAATHWRLQLSGHYEI